MADNLRRDTDDVRDDTDELRDGIGALEAMLESLRHSGDARVVQTIEASLRARIEELKRAMNE